jgi:hypothetical protein
MMVDPRSVDADAHSEAALVRPLIPWGRYAVFGLLMGGFTLVLAYGFGVAIRTRLDRNVAIGTCAGILVLLALGGLRLCLVGRFASLRVESGQLVAVNAMGLARRFAAGRVAHIYQASVDLTVRSSWTLRYFLFIDGTGRTVFKLPATWWPDAGIDAVGNALGIPVDRSTETLDGPAFRRAFPGSIPWVVAHPRLAASLGGVALFVALILVLDAPSLMRGAS